MSSNDGRTKPDDRAQWVLAVDFTIDNMEGTVYEVVRKEILATNCILGEIPAGANNFGVVLTGGVNVGSNTTTAHGTTTEAAAASAVTTTTTTATTTASTTTVAHGWNILLRE